MNYDPYSNVQVRFARKLNWNDPIEGPEETHHHLGWHLLGYAAAIAGFVALVLL